ncbi:MAG: type II secretion system protein GspD [Gemmatimonadetes bacterium]|nr:type II secretion system protein GspD [Gemmatimonadota bacterium]
MPVPARLASLLLLAVVPSLPGQNPPRRPPATTPAPAPVPSVALDFQDQDLRTVLAALAEAGGVNVSLSNIPATKVTLRMGKAVDRAEFAAMLRAVAEANDLKVATAGSLMQISGTPQVIGPTVQQQARLDAAAAEMKLYTFRLKHTSATQLAPVLTALFSGGSISTQNAAARGAAGQGGRGAAATQGVTVVQGGGRGAAGQAQQQQANPLQGLQALFGGNQAVTNEVRIVGEESSNALLIRATAADWVLIQQVLAAVDLRPLQVLIEVTIAEVARNTDLNVGVSGTGTRTKGNSADSASMPSAATARDFILKLTGGNGTIDYNVALNALQTRGDVRVLSLPVIIAQNNREAVLNVGEQRPFVQVSQSIQTGATPTTVQTITYLDVGTVLTITPTINPDGYVNLTVSQTDNNATNEVAFNAPVISKRELTTQVFLKDGQTTVIGGLAGKSSSKTESGIPILSKIPLIGKWLFGNVRETSTTSELFLFLTPHVIFTDVDIDQLRRSVEDGSELLKQVPTGARIVPKADTIGLPVIRRPDSTAVRRPVGGGTP